MPADSWIGLYHDPTRSVLFPIPVVQSLWCSAGILRETKYVLDDATLAEIDRHLCAYFSLPMPGG